MSGNMYLWVDLLNEADLEEAIAGAYLREEQLLADMGLIKGQKNSKWKALGPKLKTSGLIDCLPNPIRGLTINVRYKKSYNVDGEAVYRRYIICDFGCLIDKKPVRTRWQCKSYEIFCKRWPIYIKEIKRIRGLSRAGNGWSEVPFSLAQYKVAVTKSDIRHKRNQVKKMKAL